jgi:hypothetical protein
VRHSQISVAIGRLLQAPRESQMASTASAVSRPESAVVDEATNLVVLVPEADDALAASNRLLPAGKRLTAPAHITLVYPFMPLDAVAAASAEMESFFAGLGPVSFGLQVGWFGQEVLILIPDPAEPLIHLTQAILDQWPQYPYYGGMYDKVEPHLSLAFGTAQLLEPIAAGVEPLLPISVTIAAVTLLVGPHESMTAGPSFRLGR